MLTDFESLNILLSTTTFISLATAAGQLIPVSDPPNSLTHPVISDLGRAMANVPEISSYLDLQERDDLLRDHL